MKFKTYKEDKAIDKLILDMQRLEWLVMLPDDISKEIMNAGDTITLSTNIWEGSWRMWKIREHNQINKTMHAAWRWNFSIPYDVYKNYF